MEGWRADFMEVSPVFAPVSCVWEAAWGGGGWPALDTLNEALVRVGGAVSEGGAPIRFVAQGPKVQTLGEHYEARIYRDGEVQTRVPDWHDFYNALTWMLFPASKAAVNARHYEALCRDEAVLGTRARRSVEEDVLTLFHENGVAVVSAEPELLQLMREFRWLELFWERREEVREKMTFFMFGHALYEKFLTPYVGLTGHSILYEVDEGFFAAPVQEQLAHVDGLMAADFGDASPASWSIQKTRDFAPFPMLGFPGLVPESEARGYYLNERYFRPGRRSRG